MILLAASRADDSTTPSGWDGTATAIAGSLFVVVGGVGLLGIITAEVLYPGYTTLQEISDLGASRPPDSVIEQPAATVFNATMLVSGVLVLVATAALNRGIPRRTVTGQETRTLTVALSLFGIGIFGVGLFPGNRVPWHGLFALLTFVSGGLSAVLAARIVSPPFRYLSIASGTVSLVALASAIFLGDANPLVVLGLGGIERWVVYPVLLWITAFGGYLLGTTSTHGS